MDDGDRPRPPAPAAVAETHGSVVFFAGDRAYKLLKPIRTPFLDYSTPELRRRACEREVELNRRLAPDCYLGVSHVLEDGQVADHFVVMRRLDADRRLTTLLETDRAADAVRAVARAVAAFHAGLAPDRGAARVATRDAVADLWTVQNLDDLDRHATDVVDAEDLATVRRLATTYLAGRGPLFEDRIAQGRAVDGHGDLLADDIFCMDDGPRILDCLAFDDDLRRGDVVADVAFLAMDLERLAGAWAAELLLEVWQEDTGDHPPASLVHHWIAERALVRAKVGALRAGQGDDDAGRSAARDARAHLAQCLDHLRAGAVRLVLVGGAPGTGKSTVARALAERTGAVLLSSDEVRKELAGVAADDHVDEPLDAGRYSPAATGRTYAELLLRAGTLLGRGESVVLDATWADADRRSQARSLADRCSAALEEHRCVLDPGVAAGRIAARRAAGGDASDVSPELSRALAARFDPWPQSTEHDTSGPPVATP